MTLTAKQATTIQMLRDSAFCPEWSRQHGCFVVYTGVHSSILGALQKKGLVSAKVIFKGGYATSDFAVTP